MCYRRSAENLAKKNRKEYFLMFSKKEKPEETDSSFLEEGVLLNKIRIFQKKMPILYTAFPFFR